LVQVRDKQDSLRACMEDLANLTDHYNNVRAAKELAQKELAKIKRQVEEARHDWTRKIRERRAEVRGQTTSCAGAGYGAASAVMAHAGCTRHGSCCRPKHCCTDFKPCVSVCR
jgi:ElaB/YqjD/DUF883 family membrane-anchored ribosome-binding protein